MLADYVKKNPVKDAEIQAEYDNIKPLSAQPNITRVIFWCHRTGSQGYYRQAERRR
jgi:hypothetical protein